MSSLYLLRHDVKAWKNGRKPSGVDGAQHDPPLLHLNIPSSTLLESIERLKGITFDAVLCSPFLRTRQTYDLLQSHLSLPQITIVSGLGEYLGNHRSSHQADLDSVTLTYYNPFLLSAMIRESIGSLRRRVARVVIPAGKVLVITHGLIAETLGATGLEEGGLYVK